ncbi:MAG: hypothetical protein R3Y61_04240 [Rikenellaceae bacterium]
MKQFLVLLTFAAISVAVFPLRALDKFCHFDVCVLGWFVLNFVAMVFFIKRYKDKPKSTSILLFALIGTIIINLPVIIYGLPYTFSASLSLISALCGALAGFMFTTVATKTRKVIFLIVCVALVVLLSTYVKGLWIDIASTLR